MQKMGLALFNLYLIFQCVTYGLLLVESYGRHYEYYLSDLLHFPQPKKKSTAVGGLQTPP